MWDPATGEIVACTSQNAGRRSWAFAGTAFDDTIVVPGNDFASAATLPHASCADAIAGALSAAAAHSEISERMLTSSDSSPGDASTLEAIRQARCGCRS